MHDAMSGFMYLFTVYTVTKVVVTTATNHNKKHLRSLKISFVN